MSYLTKTKMKLELPALGYVADGPKLRVGQREFLFEPNLHKEASPWNLVEVDDENELATAAVCLNILGKVIGAPKFHEWLGVVKADRDLAQAVKTDTTEVIGSTFRIFNPEFKFPRTDAPLWMGCDMRINNYNHVTLQTIGDCACLGPHADGHWVGWQDWETEGYCEYDFHNNDDDSQTWSLLAGMGHLAALCLEAAS